VLIVDDNVQVRETLREALAKEPALDVIGEAADGLTAVQLVQELAPQVVLMDVYMPRLNGVEATRRIHATTPCTVIIGMSTDVNAFVEQNMLSAGARVFLAKERVMLDLPSVIRQELPEATRGWGPMV
jgi:DNA-binding NarL/FixJ family response regulator